MYIKTHTNSKVDFLNSGAGDSDTVDVSWRLLPVYLLIIGIFGFIIWNLIDLQVINGDKYLAKASLVSSVDRVILPPRGLIYDINGNKLAYNVPSYSVFIDSTLLTKENEQSVLATLSQVFNLDNAELVEYYNDRAYIEGIRTKAQRISILNDVSFNQYIDSISLIESLEGVVVQMEPVRTYVDGDKFSHIIGYVGDPTQSDIDDGIYPKAQVGREGIEDIYDEYLRGENGLEVLEAGVDSQQSFSPKQAIYGDNLYLTIDSDWQKALGSIMESEASKIGAFGSAGVVMNSSTGEIKALVSLPTFDNNLFVNGISYAEYNKLMFDPHKPQLNRVISAQLPPGSIFKVVGATAGLEEGVINRQTEYMSDRCMDLPGGIKFCEANKQYLGKVNITSAIARSSNIYFCNVALSLGHDDGIYKLNKYASLYGIGQKTGIDLSGESYGHLASPELKQKNWNEPWYVGDTCNAIIGQGLVAVTPLQMTVLASAISNEGKVVQPYLLDSVKDQNENIVFETKTKVMSELDFDQSTYDIVKDGMAESVNAGTAKKLTNLPNDIIAKTGSAEACETIDGKRKCGAHSWVMGCFDFEGENYCFTLLHQWGGWGSNTVPTAERFINCVNNNFEGSCNQ